MRRSCASMLHQQLLSHTSPAAVRLRGKAASRLAAAFPSNTFQDSVAASRSFCPSPPSAAESVYRRGFSHNAVASESSQAASGDSGEVERHNFKAETQKLLQIVTHSLYTDREVFIRELISNASDALEKLRFMQVTQQQTPQQGQLRVVLRGNPSEKTFTIEDNGVGMTRSELFTNLGTIAKSGSLEFLKRAGEEAAKDIIGQRVEVYTRSGEGEALCWASDGSGSFTLNKAPDAALSSSRGTKVVCRLKPDCLEFANPHRVKECAKKFSAFVNFPVFVEEGGKEVQVASQEALWLKTSATFEEHKQFFRYLANQSWGEPFYCIMFSADAPLSIRSVLYFPSDPPNRLFQTGPVESGVSLHCRRVLVKKHASDLLPKWLWFLRGVVDCEDLPLNVSREHVQDTQLQRKLASVIVKRILKFLNDQAKSDPKRFIEFYQKYSQNIKEGVLEDAHNGSQYKDMLLPLLRFQCSTEDSGKLITLEDYIEKMPSKQKHIYFYCCSDRTTALSSPYMEQFLAKKRPVLLMNSDIDEFVTMNLSDYKGKRFVAVDSPGEDMEPEELEEEDSELSKETEQRPKLVGDQQAELSGFVKETLGSRVTSVKFSERLLSAPAVVSGFLSPTLRRMMKATLQGAPEAQLSMASLPATLELNPSHELITALYHLRKTNSDVAKLLVEQLLDNASIAAGILEEPKTMLSRLNKLLSLTAQYAYHHAGKASESAAPAEAAKSKPDATAEVSNAEGES